MSTNHSVVCLTPGCRKVGIHRGHCGSCIKQLRKLIAAGETTEKELVAAGRLLPAKRVHIAFYRGTK